MDLYLRCMTQQEVADKVGLSQGTIAEIIRKLQLQVEGIPRHPITYGSSAR
jgi:transcriptional regulator with XRE-family HTH domain